jgi:acyl-CoA thioesterase FadM
MYEYEWTCRWDHLDPADQAYFPRLVNACHQAGDAFMEHIGWPYWDNPEEHGMALPIVESGYQFRRPVKPGDTVTIAVDPDLGTSSVRLEFEATHEDGGTAFTGVEQHVCVPTGGDSSTPLPDGFREAVSEFLADEA